MRMTPRVAGFRSEYQAGLRLEYMAGFVGIRMPARERASRLFSRMSRNARRLDDRISLTPNRARTLRWPSPWNGLSSRTTRIACSNAASGKGSNRIEALS